MRLITTVLSFYCNLYCSFSSLRFSEASLFFPTNSAYGILAAIAVPLELPHRNVYFSYNFEANYNLPYEWGIPPIAHGIEDEDFFEHEMRQLKECTNCTTTTTTAAATAPKLTSKPQTKQKVNKTKENRGKRSLLTRTNFYQILTHKFQRYNNFINIDYEESSTNYIDNLFSRKISNTTFLIVVYSRSNGYPGKACLLRLICETNSSSLGDMNGVLGSLIHILFAPSSSMDEDLPLIYYQAESDGVNEKCDHYARKCKVNLLDFISMPLREIISNLSK